MVSRVWRLRPVRLVSGTGGAVTGGVATVVDDDDSPAGVRGAGGGLGEVAGQGRVEGAEQPGLARPLGSFLEGGQRGGHLGEDGPGPGSARAVIIVIVIAAAARPRTAARIPSAWIAVIV